MKLAIKERKCGPVLCKSEIRLSRSATEVLEVRRFVESLHWEDAEVGSPNASLLWPNVARMLSISAIVFRFESCEDSLEDFKLSVDPGFHTPPFCDDPGGFIDVAFGESREARRSSKSLVSNLLLVVVEVVESGLEATPVFRLFRTLGCMSNAAIWFSISEKLMFDTSMGFCWVLSMVFRSKLNSNSPEGAGAFSVLCIDCSKASRAAFSEATMGRGCCVG